MLTNCECFYCRNFANWQTGKHEWYFPFKILWYRVWYFIPRYIRKQNRKYQQTFSDPLIPYKGLVLELEEGQVMPDWRWWRNIKRIN